MIKAFSPQGPIAYSNLILKIFVHEGGKLPQKGKPGDAGIDAFASILKDGHARTLEVSQGDLVKVSLGFSYAFWYEGDLGPTNDFWLDVRNRSGVGTKSGMATVAEVGDANYRGVLHYCAAKITPGSFVVCHGDKIAQLLINPFVDPHKVRIEQVSFVEELGSSARGDSGFGASGK